ncbi:restriction endonuclease subunit S [Salinibacillus aidingensis]|uniref:Restriction endonuclease subunit S n=1 Tax=Salinibacillus aidingensis TaxID=237684 RepID=A0ABP3LAQ5_9BACI
MVQEFQKTGIGKIPSDWRIETLSSIAEVNPESLSPKTPENEIIEYIDIESIKEGKIKGTKILAFKEAPSRARRIVRKNDVIVSTVRPYLKAFTLVEDSRENLICSTGFAVLRPKKGISARFIYHYTFSNKFLSQLLRKMVGSNYPAVNNTDVSNALIPIPSFREQQKIAEILTTVNEQIEQTDQLITKTKELQKGLMQKLLFKGIGHSEFKETVVGNIPNEWRLVTFKDISTISQGLQVAITDRYKEPGHNRYFYITIQYLNDKNNKENTYFIENPRESVLCNKDDILMTRTGNTGVVISNVEGAFHNNFFKVDYDKKLINKDFLVYYLKSNIIQNIIKRLAGTTTIPDLKHGDFYNIPVVLPELDEQKNIASILSSTDKQIKQYSVNKQKFIDLKKGLMQKLLSGKIRVKV